MDKKQATATKCACKCGQIRLKKPGTDFRKEDERGGKVRQLFEERRGAGRDKSYPLEPLRHKVASLDRINYNIEEQPLNREFQTRSHKVTSQSKQPTELPIFRRLPNLGGNLYSSQNQDILSNRPVICGNYKEMDRHSIKKDIGSADISSLSKSLRSMKVGSPNQNVVNDSKPISKRPNEMKSKIAKPSSPSIIPTRKPSSIPTRNVLSPQNATATKPRTSIPSPTTKSSVPTMNRIKSPTTVSAPHKNIAVSEPPKPKSPPQDGRKDCPICGRFFLPDRLAVHEKICKKSKTKKRKAFDPVKHRVQGTEAESYLRQPTKTVANAPRPKLNWRQKHEEFISAIRAAKEAQAYVAKGGKLSDLPPPPPLDTSHYTPCPHCGRKFNESAAARHIPKCADMKHNKPKPQSKVNTRMNRIK
ncbi:zinc finger C2HC domain-containing protein 1C-like isoform X2 [Cimex lectularius]|uniref:C2HC/C3H-type domain-containing protein n=1 Tax=Cimex lectularius TaxID=79782 RepID=A0A8I6RGC6_CIMLE|nr:zinc finger C2HC domain-containing protein 1C-like isoform X2 [Cimex lectularius]XP_014245035.1 zinc finger C2HC domain-containing protein 1C-like isoform X2 [Cimex lectularius]